MQELVNLLTDRNVITFLLLLVKMSALIAFMPFFSFAAFSNSVKAPLALLFTVVFYPLAPLYNLDINLSTLLLAITSEVLFAFIASFMLKIIFDVIIHAAELISLTMGLSMAMVFDPLTQNQSTVIGQALSLTSILVFITFNGDHLIITFASESLKYNPLGVFNMNSQVGEYILLQMKNFFVLGFSMAFPVLAVGLLGDIIFGMIMKNMPQFNLLVLGFPIKITLSIIVIMTVMGSIMFLFQNNFLNMYNSLGILFTK